MLLCRAFKRSSSVLMSQIVGWLPTSQTLPSSAISDIQNRLPTVLQSASLMLTFIYILDSILKNVQGHYIRLFEQRIGEIFQVAFENTSRESEKKALIKLIQVWQLFINSGILAAIYNRLGLKQIEQTVLNANDLKKIADFKFDFFPSSLPQEVIESGNFKLGENVTKDYFLSELRQRQQQPQSADEHSSKTSAIGHHLTQHQTQSYGGVPQNSAGFNNQQPALQQAFKNTTFDQKPSQSMQPNSFLYNAAHLSGSQLDPLLGGGNSGIQYYPPFQAPQGNFITQQSGAGMRGAYTEPAVIFPAAAASGVQMTNQERVRQLIQNLPTRGTTAVADPNLNIPYNSHQQPPTGYPASSYPPTTSQYQQQGYGGPQFQPPINGLHPGGYPQPYYPQQQPPQYMRPIGGAPPQTQANGYMQQSPYPVGPAAQPPYLQQQYPQHHSHHIGDPNFAANFYIKIFLLLQSSPIVQDRIVRPPPRFVARKEGCSCALLQERQGALRVQRVRNR
ncbi:hypothetical protein FGO68_gene11194 [Halteria grandinella]|uniref:CID domain-containing protein n=1 Tax=Halteria grandinella TaxID=5974 RepID=A0A8J8T954_HALGN|nr:hypothetical protein FGO68_gene11194 [Halteria grandinella]